MAAVLKKILIISKNIIRPAEKIGGYSIFLSTACRNILILFDPKKMLIEKAASIGQVVILGGVVFGDFGCKFSFFKRLLLAIAIANVNSEN